MKNIIPIGLLGCGHVGGALVELLQKDRDALARRAGIIFSIRHILVRDLDKSRNPYVHRAWLTAHPTQVLQDPRTKIIIEVMGGAQPAFTYLQQALHRGKHVITSNKLLVATSGPELARWARQHRRRFTYEASVAAAIPVLKALDSSPALGTVFRIEGILNGTSNYLLRGLSNGSASWREVLPQAIEQGFAEADPQEDISGRDSAYKLSILIRRLAGYDVPPETIACEGIEAVRPEDVKMAETLGYSLKLLAQFRAQRRMARGTRQGQISPPFPTLYARVAPFLIPSRHFLAQVQNEDNGIYLETQHAGPLFFYGKGAGPVPTASALLQDMLDVVKHGTAAEQTVSWAGKPRWTSKKNIQTRLWIRIPEVHPPPFRNPTKNPSRRTVFRTVYGWLKKLAIPVEHIHRGTFNPGRTSQQVVITQPTPETQIDVLKQVLKKHPETAALPVFRIYEA